jgi:3'-5' exonuclease
VASPQRKVTATIGCRHQREYRKPIIPVGMPRRKIVVDIETIPCVDAQRAFIPPPRSAPERGFWQRLFQRFQRQVPGEQPYLQTALDWTLGRIVCIGLCVESENQKPQEQAFLARITPQDSPTESLAKEAEALKAFWQFVLPDDYFIGHNILGFDLPFLWNRSIVCGVCPSRSLNLQPESIEFTFDTMQVWAQWSSNPSNRRWVKLDTLAQVMGLRAKTASGSQVYGWWQEQRFEQIHDYCLSDARLEYDLYRRLTLDGNAPAVRWK